MRDLTDEPADVVAAERARVATEGWGARLLALQAPDGLWAGNAVVAGLDRHVPRPGAPAPARARSRRASRRGGRSGCVREHVTWGDGAWWDPPWADNPFFEGEVEPCINGNVVATGAYFGVDMTPLVERLLGEQLADGGWNCEVENGATVSSFGTTINVLEGLLEHERAVGGPASGGAEARRARRGVHARAAPVPPEVDGRGDRPELAPRSRSRPGGTTTSCAGSTTCATPGVTPDERVAEAVERRRGQAAIADGRWPLQNVHQGEAYLRDGGGRGRAEPLEHAPRAARARLVYRRRLTHIGHTDT